ncbi:MAG TPA: TonB-dependent receptor [Gemmatimonadales bacterium]|nr:TonB-dependent receptor [Gemmatimonadales bacterium]
MAARGAAQADTTARDTTARDTTARDTLPLALPVFARALPLGPLPAGARYVFDTDSLAFSNIYTLSDLLGHVPGVYLARGGFIGQAEYAFYGGRGAQGVEVYWDGIPFLPLGRDSAYLDPARIPLGALERVEVLPLPGVLRVYLVSRRQGSTAASSAVGIVSGDRNIARYRGFFARRWRAGPGLALAFERHGVDGAPGTSSSSFSETDLWLNFEYTPSPRAGISYQILSTTWSRDPEAGLVDRWRARRRDGLLRFFVAPGGEGLGPRLQLAVTATRVEGDSAVPGTGTGQVLLDATHTWARGHAALSVRAGERRRPLEVEARGAWIPIRGVTLAAEARRSRYRDHREGHRAHVSAGLELPVGFSLRGEAVWARGPAAPLWRSDPAQETVDLAWAARWERHWITLEVGGGRRDGFVPGVAPAGLKSVTGLGATPPTDYVRVAGALRPVPWLSLAGWYFDPLAGGGDFEPPRHARISATFFSRFLRVFRSGIFALRGETAVESWSSWVGGIRGADRNQLIGATFVDHNVELQIGDVTAFWTMRNATGMRASFVPGLDYPKLIQFFGVQWQFRN